MTSQNMESKGTTPPYIAFQTLKTLTRDLKQHRPPSRIDRSVLKNFSGAVASQILATLRFFELVDGQGHPTEKLHSLVGSWATELEAVLRNAYPPIFSLNLDTASASQFEGLFAKTYPGAASVQRKAVTFFLNAASDAQIKLSPYITKNRKPRSGPTRRRTAKVKGAAGTDTNPDEEKTPLPNGQGRLNDPPEKTWHDRLLDKFPAFDPAWSPEMQSKWMESFEKLMAMKS
jgi:hypothetical protein